jgi:hypothetical protein
LGWSGNFVDFKSGHIPRVKIPQNVVVFHYQ